MGDFEQMRRDWWVRRAILHLMAHKCFCPEVLTCIPCQQLEEAQEFWPVQYAQALDMYAQFKKETHQHGI